MLPNETIDTNPFFTMLSEWMLRDTLENVGRNTKPKPNDNNTINSGDNTADSRTDIKNINKD